MRRTSHAGARTWITAIKRKIIIIHATIETESRIFNSIFKCQHGCFAVRSLFKTIVSTTDQDELSPFGAMDSFIIKTEVCLKCVLKAPVLRYVCQCEHVCWQSLHHTISHLATPACCSPVDLSKSLKMHTRMNQQWKTDETHTTSEMLYRFLVWLTFDVHDEFSHSDVSHKWVDYENVSVRSEHMISCK